MIQILEKLIAKGIKVAKENKYMRSLIQLRSMLYGQPLFISLDKAEVLRCVLEKAIESKMRKEDLVIQTEEGEEEEYGEKETISYKVIPIKGTITYKTYGLDSYSGLVGYSAIQKEIQEGLDNTEYEGIILDIDSPGGSKTGLFELMTYIQEARKTKPIYAYVHYNAFSAAYGIAASCTAIFGSISSSVGSIGVVYLHEDRTLNDENRGVKYTAFYRGRHKIDLSPHFPLTDEAKKEVEYALDKAYDGFIDLVSKGRGLSTEILRDTEAKTYDLEDGIREKLIDHTVSSIQEIVTYGGNYKMSKEKDKLSLEELRAMPEFEQAVAEEAESRLSTQVEAKVETEVKAAIEGYKNAEGKKLIDEAVKAERKRATEIVNICKGLELQNAALAFIRDGADANIVKTAVLCLLKNESPEDAILSASPTGDGDVLKKTAVERYKAQ